jgi:hypothetical protein
MTRFTISGGWLAATVLALAAGLTAAPAISQLPGTSGRLRASTLLNGSQIGSYSADVIRIWHGVAAAQPTNPIRQSRVLAMVHAAMHDAVNGAIPVYEPYASWLSDGDAHPEAAAAAAAHRVLANLFPSNIAVFDEQLTDSLAGVPDGPAKERGRRPRIRRRRLHRAGPGERRNGRSGSLQSHSGPGRVGTDASNAFPPAIEPQMANVTPFTIRSRDQFLVDPPPGLLTHEYARDYNEVKALGRDTSTGRTADQTHAAHFWFEPSNLGWSRIAGIYTLQNGTGLHDTARLFALLNMAMADGYIAGFYWKQTHALWRPVTAIRKGDTDGNPGTDPDPLWNALRPTPPSPDYPSTHSVLGSAAAQILRHVTGSDRFPFCMTSLSSVPGIRALLHRVLGRGPR